MIYTLFLNRSILHTPGAVFLCLERSNIIYGQNRKCIKPLSSSCCFKIEVTGINLLLRTVNTSLIECFSDVQMTAYFSASSSMSCTSPCDRLSALAIASCVHPLLKSFSTFSRVPTAVEPSVLLTGFSVLTKSASNFS